MSDNYKSWPLGQVPKDLQRKELDVIRAMGYEWEDPRDVIDIFEQKVAKFVGSKFAVSCDCCTHGLFLVLKYLNECCDLTIPNKTYISVPMIIEQAGYRVNFERLDWSGCYQLKPLPVWDCAARWTKDMYLGDNVFQVVSFQIKKRIPIGRGGMILTNDLDAYKVLKLMSYDGRDMDIPYNHPDHVKTEGYHFYMTPEDAARGIFLMDHTPEVNEDMWDSSHYPELDSFYFFGGRV